MLIDLASDTATRPSPEMRRAMCEAPVGDEQRNEDPTTKELQEYTAELLGKEAALFLPSATMGNQIAYKVHTQPGDEIIMHNETHAKNIEAGGPAFLSGASIYTLDGPYGLFEPEQVEEAIRPDDPHYPRSRVLSLENTHNMGGGTIWPIDKLIDVTDVARNHGLATHLDGARLMNAVVATGIPANEYCRYFDSVTICFSKGLGAPVGAAVAGSKEFIRWARRYKHVFGGAMRQSGIIAAGALYGLKHNIGRLAEDHINARTLAFGLASIPGITLDINTVQTNIIFFDVADTGLTSQEYCSRLEKKGVRMQPRPGTIIRAVTHLDVSSENIRTAIAAAANIC